MAEVGILSPDERVELIRGRILEMRPKTRAHVIGVYLVEEPLRTALSGRASVFMYAPLRLESLDSDPEPDVTVYSNPDAEAYGTDATEPMLVVEVADSSLAYDLGDKAKLYAEAGIPEYWVLNLVDRVLVVFRDPRAGRFESRSEWAAGACVAPKAWPDVSVDVASLFPAELPPSGNDA